MLIILSMIVMGAWTGLLAFFHSIEPRSSVTKTLVVASNPPVLIRDASQLKDVGPSRSGEISSGAWSAFRNLMDEILYGR